MQSIAYIPGSDGVANASLMTVSTVRAPLASTILVNTVANVPDKFYGSMGTPNTFTDPITGETITVISEATAVDFAGHVDGSNIEIDAIAPGYTDNGSEVGDIIIIRPVTEWANNIHNVLNEAHEDDGKLKSGAADRALNAPQGFLINGKIERSVASNNITVAIKTLAGTDPTADDPVYVRIGNTIRSVTAACSVTLNAGTNWFGAGASFFGGVEGDFFAYLIWNTNTSSVILGVAKEPDMVVFSNRDATSTNYGHLAITGTAPAATDEMEVVGRFNAILGVSASYNWSLPATALVLSRPIYETRIFSYTNNGTAGGTFRYVQKGSTKEVYGLTNAVGTGSKTVNLPTGFLTWRDVQSNAVGGYNNTNQVVSHIEAQSSNVMTLQLIVTGGTNPSNPMTMHVWGD